MLASSFSYRESVSIRCNTFSPDRFMNTNLWLIELELPKGVFIVRQSPMTKTEEELEAEIRASDTILQTPPEPSQAIPSTHSKPALLSYHGLHSVAEAIATMLSRQFPNPQRPWTPQLFRDLGRVIWECRTTHGYARRESRSPVGNGGEAF